MLEKIAVDAFKAGYEVSEAEEFEDDDGKPIFCFDIISEVELKAEIIDAQQKRNPSVIRKNIKAFMMVGAPILKIRMPMTMNTAMMGNFLMTRMSKSLVCINYSF